MINKLGTDHFIFDGGGGGGGAWVNSKEKMPAKRQRDECRKTDLNT